MSGLLFRPESDPPAAAAAGDSAPSRRTRAVKARRRAVGAAPPRRQLSLMLPIDGGASAPASFERRLLEIIARDLQDLSLDDAAQLGDCNPRTAENLQGMRNLPRLPTFLCLLGDRVNMAVAIFDELRRRGLLQPDVAAALAVALGQRAAA